LKKIYIVLIIVVCILTSLACGSSTSGDNAVVVNEEESVGDISSTTEEGENDKISPTTEEENSEVVTLEEAKPTSTPDNKVNVEEQVLLEQDGVLITLKSLSYDGFFGPSLKVLIENKSEKDITVQVRKTVVNDVMVDTLFSSDVAAGKKANDEITYMGSDLKEANIETIKSFELVLILIDPDSFDTIFETEPLTITTSADPSYVQTFDDSGFVALDKNDLKIVVQKLDSEDSFWGADIYVYIENNSSRDITVQLRDVSINGFMIDPIFSSDILPGKKAYDSITFFESDLTDNEINTIDELSLKFHVFDADSWDTIFDSEIVTISFTK